MTFALARGGHPRPGQGTWQWLNEFGLEFLLDFVEGLIRNGMDGNEKQVRKFEQHLRQAARQWAAARAGVEYSKYEDPDDQARRIARNVQALGQLDNARKGRADVSNVVPIRPEGATV